MPSDYVSVKKQGTIEIHLGIYGLLCSYVVILFKQQFSQNWTWEQYNINIPNYQTEVKYYV